MKRNTYYIDEKVEKEKVDVKLLRRLLLYVAPRKKTFGIILVLLLSATLAALVPPLFIKAIVDKVIPDKNYALLVRVLVGFVAVSALRVILPYFYNRLMWRMGDSIVAELRTEIFAKLQKLPFEYFDNRPAGKISVRVTDYIDELGDFFAWNLMYFIVDILNILVVTVFMLFLSPVLALVVYAAVIPMTVCIFLLKGVVRKYFRVQKAKDSNRTAYIVESINGEKVIKSFSRAAYNEGVYHQLQTASRRQWEKIVMANELNSPIVDLFWNLGTLLIYAVSIWAVTAGKWSMQTGTVIAFLNYMSLCASPFMQLSSILQNLSQVSANLERVFETIDEQNPITEKNDAKELANVRGEVDFEKVTFGYEAGINVLENFDLHVAAGETIALVGPTGAGKTTVINLITRFYDPAAGCVKIDGINVRDVTLGSLRSRVGVLMQDPFIFKGTIIDNIRYGRPGATDEECIAAAERIYADRVAKRYPDGFYAKTEEGGEGLSAREKQLISFARMVLKDPSVVILDEATSSVDSETEELIREALEILLKDKTAFIVAHRLATIRKADRILYIADKGIAESGNHEQLLAKKGLYYRLNAGL